MRTVLLLAALSALVGTAQSQPIPCESVVELNTVFFDVAADTLDRYGRERLDENMTILRPCAAWHVVIDGYTDGDEANRQSLSERRAQAVRDYYLAAGLDTERLLVRGQGKYPNAHSEDDPGPGDRNARRVDSIPLARAAFSALPVEAPPEDPAPYTEHVVDGFRLTVDWAPADEPTHADCPRTDSTLGYRLHSAVLDRYGERYPLDPACIYTDDPVGTLYNRQIANVHPDIYVLEGHIAQRGNDQAYAWILGPDGQHQTDDSFCTSYAEKARLLDRLLLRIAQARAVGDAAIEAAAYIELDATLGRMLPYLKTVWTVGGTVEGIRLDCAALENPSHSH